jgi:hypothetical protein
MRLAILALAAISALGAPALAHHSFADYDAQKRMTFTGVLKTVRFANPHIGLELETKGPGGAVEVWEFSGPSPNDWRSEGWTKSDFVVGSQVTITGFPKRDGSKHSSINTLKNAAGKSWGREYK